MRIALPVDRNEVLDRIGELSQRVKGTLSASALSISALACAVLRKASVITSNSTSQHLVSLSRSSLNSIQHWFALSILGGLSTPALVVLTVACVVLVVLGIGALLSDRCKTVFIQTTKMCALVVGVTLGVSCLGGLYLSMAAPYWRITSFLMQMPGQLGVVHSSFAQGAVGAAGSAIAGLVLWTLFKRTSTSSKHQSDGGNESVAPAEGGDSDYGKGIQTPYAGEGPRADSTQGVRHGAPDTEDRDCGDRSITAQKSPSPHRLSPRLRTRRQGTQPPRYLRREAVSYYTSPKNASGRPLQRHDASGQGHVHSSRSRSPRRQS